MLDRAVELGRKVDDPFTLSLALRFLGDIAINVDADVDKAEVLLDESLAAAERYDEPWACVRTLLFAGWVPWTRGDHDGGREDLAPRARGRRSRGRLGARAGAQLALDQPDRLATGSSPTPRRRSGRRSS